MKIFPAIDIKDKKCVRLIKGDFENKTEYEMSPVEQAGKYKDNGFKNLHIVDLDGALTGETTNLDIIQDIVSKFDLKIEVGGGVRNFENIKKYINSGVEKVILGSAAIKDKSFLKDWNNKSDKKKITNIVFMGMGEPFLNYARVIKAADLLNEPGGIDLGARRITISTVGIIPKIKQFTKEGHRYKLAISLNGTTQNQRLQTMPAAKKYPIHKLIDAAKNYYETAKRFPTFEYVLINNLNDRTTDAENLIKLIGNLPCKVNLIPYNEIGGNYKRPSHDRLTRFINALKNVPFTVTVRWSNGTEIDAGCGQLAVNAGGGVQS